MSILIIITFLLAKSLLTVGAIEIPKITQELEFSSENSHIVAIGSNLFIVSLSITNNNGEGEVYWNVTSTDNNIEGCIIQADPRGRLHRTIKAAPLSHKIVLWDDGYSKSSENSTLVNYDIVLLDTKRCTHQALDLIDKTPSFYNLIKPELVIRQEKFDFYYPSQIECSPCTYDSNGNKAKVTQQLRPQIVKSQFNVRTMGQTQRSVAVYHLFNESIVVTFDLFDENLSSESSRLLEFNTKLIAVAENSIAPYVGIISAFPKHVPKIPIYTVFDNELNTVFEVYPPLLDGCIFENAVANIDLLGNSYVTLIQKEKKGINHLTSLVRYDINGHLVNQILLDTRDRMQTSTLEWRDQALLLDMEEYCLITDVSNGSENFTKTTYVKCIDISGTS